MKLMLNRSGFALPTVLIASLTMLIVLLATLSAATSISTALQNQYYIKLSKEAAESGLAMANACIERGGTPTWSNSSPLRPNTDCGGGYACTSGDQCYVLSNATIKSTFSVGTPTLGTDGNYTIPVSATVQLLRASNGSVWKTYSQALTENLQVGWKQISAGYNYTCGIALDNNAYCWGYGGNGRLGDGTTASSTVPKPVSTSGVLAGKTIRQIATSGSTTCVIASDNKAYCWGYNGGSYYGVLGNNTSVTNSPDPVAVYTGGVLAGKTIKQISGGNHHFCVIASDDKGYCWGDNITGELGNNTETTAANPAPVAVYMNGALLGQSLKKITAGRDFTCAITTNFRAYCWGYGYYGQQGDNVTHGPDNLQPVAVYSGGVLSGKNVVDISAGYYHACAVTSDGIGACWGDNSHGEIGNGSTTNVIAPTAVSTSGVLSGEKLTQISAGHYFTCAVASDNHVYCWGYNSDGQLGNGTTADSSVPVAMDTSGVLSGKSVSFVTTTQLGSSFMLTTEDRLYATGSNAWSEFGTGTYIGSTTPVLGGTAASAFLY